MSTLKRCTSLLLVLGILFGVLAPAAQAAPVEDAASVNTDNVTIEGTNGFGNLLSQEITESQEEAEAADAEYPGGYTVTDLVIEGSTATVTYDTMEEATLVVALYTEDGMQMLTSTTATVTPDAMEAELTFEGEMPEYFLASAYLLDSYDLSPLCAAYDTPMYTREMQELLASTVNDYDPEKVLNLDEDETTNFAVFADGVIIIEPVDGVNTVSGVDEENSIYVIENADSTIIELEENSIFVYPYGEEEILTVKVASVTVENSTATIQGAELELDEVFSHVKIESIADPKNAEVEEDSGSEAVNYLGRIEPDHAMLTNGDEGSDSSSDFFKFSVFYESEKDSNGNSVRVKGDLALDLDADFSFHKADWRSHVRFQVDTIIDFGISITGRKTIPVIPLKKINLPFKLACIKMYCEPELTLRVDASIELNGRFTATTVATFSLEHQDIYFSKMNLEWKNVEFDGEVYLFFNLKPTVSVEEGFLKCKIHIVKLLLNMPLGVRLKFLDTTLDLPDADLPDEKHTCKVCFKIPVDFVRKYSFRIVFLNKWKVEIPLSGEKSTPLFHLYWSVDHGEFKKGDCPHYVYRLNAAVTADDNTPFMNVNVTAGSEQAVTNGNGIATMYVPKGTYTVTANSGELSASKSVKVEKACKVPIRLAVDGENSGFFGSMIEGIITDNGLLVDSGFCGDDVRWELYSSGLLNILGSGEITKFESSSEVPWDDYRSSIRRIYIENGVTNIGRWGLYQCDNLYEIDLPDSVTVIDRSAFSGCDNLRRVHIPSSVKIIDRSAFYNCGNLSVISIPKNVTTIGRTAFYNCDNLININIPDSVVTIGEGAFEGCSNLTAATIGNGVIIIDKNAFYDCANLTGVTIGNSVITIGENAFYDCHKLRNINIPGSVETIAENAFYHCDDLPNVKIPSSVTTIGEDAFYSCDNLMGIFVDEQNPNYSSDEFGVLFDKEKTILIQCPSGIIGNYIIPDTVETVRNKSFLNCDNLTSVTVGSAVVTIGSDAFKTCENLLDVYVSDSVTSIGGYAFSQCSNLTNVSIGSGVTSIGDHAFSFCDKIEEIDLPDSLVSLGASAFYDCDGLQYMIIPEDITKINANTFFWCKSLEYVYIPSSVVSVGYMAFSHCDKLAEVYYGGSEEQWQSISVDKMNDALTSAIIYYNCTVFDAPANLDSIDGNYSVKETEVFSGSGRADAPTLNALYPGDYGTEVTDTYILKTAAFKDLVPNEQYVLLAMASVEVEDPLTSDNLLFIDQAEATEDGTLVFQYVQRTPADISYVMACGASNKDLKDAEITFPEMVADGELQVVDPVVVYDGVTLTEGRDYVIVGSVVFTEASEYTCYIRGIHNYTGSVECTYTVGQAENPFVDVADDSFCIDAVLWAVEKGITKGITDTHFAPDDLTTRGQIVTFLWRAAGEPEPASNANPFTDVKEEDFCYKAVLWAVENGITKGMTETIFAPNSSCTRAQAVTFLHRYMGKPAYTITGSGFTDVTDPEEFCYDAILWAVENEITGGLGDGTFGVDQTCTRGQIVTFLYRTLA